MIKSFRYIIIASALVLAACANQNVWVKDGASQQEFNSDRYACMHDSSTAAPPAAGLFTYNGNFYPVDVNQGNRNQIFDACMQAKGWYLSSPQALKQAQASKQAPCKDLWEDVRLEPIRGEIALGTTSTLSQQNNPKYISDEQLPALEALKEIGGTCRGRIAISNPRLAKIMVEVHPEPYDNIMLLYQKKITFGEYTTRQQRIIDKITSLAASENKNK